MSIDRKRAALPSSGAFFYECMDGYMRTLAESRRVWDPTGRYWYLAQGEPLPEHWRES